MFNLLVGWTYFSNPGKGNSDHQVMEKAPLVMIPECLERGQYINKPVWVTGIVDFGVSIPIAGVYVIQCPWSGQKLAVLSRGIAPEAFRPVVVLVVPREALRIGTETFVLAAQVTFFYLSDDDKGPKVNVLKFTPKGK